MRGIENHESTDRMFTSAPPPLAASTGANARVTASVPKKFVSMSRRRSSIGPDSNDAPDDTPALFTTSVTSPSCCATWAASAASVTSSPIGTTPSSTIVDGSRAAP
jgi:hypothetical protein